MAAICIALQNYLNTILGFPAKVTNEVIDQGKNIDETKINELAKTFHCLGGGNEGVEISMVRTLKFKKLIFGMIYMRCISHTFMFNQASLVKLKIFYAFKTVLKKK